MFEKTRSFLAKTLAPGSAKPGAGAGSGVVSVTAAPALLPVPTPKNALLPKQQQTFPSYVPTPVFISAPLLKKDIQAANIDISATSRLGATTPEVIRTLARLNPDFSAAKAAYLRVGIPEKYVLKAYNTDGSFNREATQIAFQIANQMNRMADYANGFNEVMSIQSLAESLGLELLMEGACCFELVLDKNRMPYKFQPIWAKQIIFREDKDAQHIFAQQYIGGQYIDLDLPTFFWQSLDQDLTTAYGISPLEAAVQPVLAASSFLADLRRVCQRHAMPRYDVTIDEEKLTNRIPPEILNDTKAKDAYLNDIISSVESVINSMGVEEAAVHFDFITIKYVEGATAAAPETFDTVKEIYDQKISTGARVLPSILGHGSGSQNIASTETMVFMMSANGMIRVKLQEIFSKAFTLAVRLFGLDVTVEFEYATINLRPESELEAFYAMKQSRVLELLSLGFLEDDEASLALTGRLTPDGFEPLSGTGFAAPSAFGGAQNPAGAQGPEDNPLGNKQGPLNQNLSPDTPKNPKSKKGAKK